MPITLAVVQATLDFNKVSLLKDLKQAIKVIDDKAKISQELANIFQIK